MTREQWIKKYNSDPEFRLKRLRILQSRNYRRQGGFPLRGAYEADIERAKKEIREGKG